MITADKLMVFFKAEKIDNVYFIKQKDIEEWLRGYLKVFRFSKRGE